MAILANHNNEQYTNNNNKKYTNILFTLLHVSCTALCWKLRWLERKIKWHHYPVNSLININSDFSLCTWKERSRVCTKPLMSGFSVYIPRVQQHYLNLSFACLCVAPPPPFLFFTVHWVTSTLWKQARLVMEGQFNFVVPGGLTKQDSSSRSSSRSSSQNSSSSSSSSVNGLWRSVRAKNIGVHRTRVQLSVGQLRRVLVQAKKPIVFLSSSSCLAAADKYQFELAVSRYCWNIPV